MNPGGNQPDTTGISAESLGFKRDLHLNATIVCLPPALDLIPQLLDALNDQERSGDLLADLIRLDPGLTADVLRVANSAAYAGGFRMETINAAVLRLGLREVYRIILQVVASPVFLSASDAAGLDLWRHSLRAALGAQVLSRALGEDGELAFTAALLHDVGKLVFHQLFGEEYLRIVREARVHNEPLLRSEAARFGTEHATVGARLLKKWNFPDPIVHSVQFHHDPGRCPKPEIRIVSLVFAANLLAHKLGGTATLPSDFLNIGRSAVRTLGLNTVEDLWPFEGQINEAFERETDRLPPPE